MSILSLLNVNNDKSKDKYHTYKDLFKKPKTSSSSYILSLLKLSSFCDEVLLSSKLSQVRKRHSSQHLQTLKVMLPKIIEGGSLSNILDQCTVNFFHEYIEPLKTGRNHDFC